MASTSLEGHRRLDEVISLLWKLSELVERQTVETKRVEALLRGATGDGERQVAEHLSKLRDTADQFVEEQVRAATRAANDLVAAEPIGPQRAAVQRAATQWIALQRSSSVKLLTEWIGSQHSIAEVVTAQLRTVVAAQRKQNTSALQTLQEFDRLLSEVQPAVVDLGRVLNAPGMPSPLRGRRRQPHPHRLRLQHDRVDDRGNLPALGPRRSQRGLDAGGGARGRFFRVDKRR